MRRACAAFVLCAAASGCRFSVNGVQTDGGSVQVDMAVGDGGDTTVDMAGCMCATGCSTSTTTCLTLQPSGPVTAGDYGLLGLAAPSVTGNIVVDTETGQISGGALPRPAG